MFQKKVRVLLTFPDSFRGTTSIGKHQDFFFFDVLENLVLRDHLFMIIVFSDPFPVPSPVFPFQTKQIKADTLETFL